jgi:signal transduction histidine kinase
LKQRDLFLRFLAHEIRTPLNIMSIGLTLAQMEMKGMAGVTEVMLSTLDDSMGALHVAEGG